MTKDATHPPGVAMTGGNNDDEFGMPIFVMSTKKETSSCCGCCKSSYDNKANFYPSLMTTVNNEKHVACCCRELPWIEHIAAYPKYKVMSVRFHDEIATPMCCTAGCPLPCCNTAVCFCCFAVNHMLIETDV